MRRPACPRGKSEFKAADRRDLVTKVYVTPEHGGGYILALRDQACEWETGD